MTRWAGGIWGSDERNEKPNEKSSEKPKGATHEKYIRRRIATGRQSIRWVGYYNKQYSEMHVMELSVPDRIYQVFDYECRIFRRSMKNLVGYLIWNDLNLRLNSRFKEEISPQEARKRYGKKLITFPLNITIPARACYETLLQEKYPDLGIDAAITHRLTNYGHALLQSAMHSGAKGQFKIGDRGKIIHHIWPDKRYMWKSIENKRQALIVKAWLETDRAKSLVVGETVQELMDWSKEKVDEEELQKIMRPPTAATAEQDMLAEIDVEKLKAELQIDDLSV